MKSNSNGAKFNDRLLAGQVRSIGLKHLAKILDEEYEDKDFQKQVILKISASLLPRLNEHSGEGGGDIPVGITITFKDGSPVSD